jgi:hypothetical protein
MTTDHEMRMEALRLFEENEALRGTIAAIVTTAGGEVEGRPTHSINILQRIRQLIEIERRDKRKPPQPPKAKLKDVG